MGDAVTPTRAVIYDMTSRPTLIDELNPVSSGFDEGGFISPPTAFKRKHLRTAYRSF